MVKTYTNLYPKLCSYKNIERAFKKASKGKNSKFYVKMFRENLIENLLQIKRELESFSYQPEPLKKFTIRDPKTRTIRKSIFKDRIIHHAIVNILEPIYEPIFIADNFANRKGKGTLTAIQRFDIFQKRVSRNGKLITHAVNNNMIKGYVFKADIRKFFDSVDQEKLLEMLKRKIKDGRVIWLIKRIIKNFDNDIKGMPLGNMTSQFFANVYLNDLDRFVKHRLKMKYYIRYVDDFVILHEDKKVLEDCKIKIEKYLMNLKIELHPDKSKIYPLYRGVDFLGFKMFYHYKRVRKRNVNHFKRKLIKLKEGYINLEVPKQKIMESVEGWFAYIKWGNSYNLKIKIIKEVRKFFEEREVKKIKEKFGQISTS